MDVNCKQCNKLIDELAVFPGGICMGCYEVVFNKMSDAEKVPNFIKAINVPKRRKGK